MNQLSGIFALKLCQRIDAIRSVSIQIYSSFYFLMVLGLLFVPFRLLFSWLFAALIHEFGHVCAIVWSGHRIEKVVLKGSGATICTDTLGSDEWFCAMAGPTAGLFLVMLRGRYPLIGICAFFQLAVNLLPFPPLDGGRLLRGLLCFVVDERCVERYTQVFGGLIAAIILMILWKCFGIDAWIMIAVVCLIILLKILQIKIPCKRRNKWVQ